MGRAPVSSRVSAEGPLNKGPWTEEEDAILIAFVKSNGEGNWRTLPKLAGLRRCRKSCRLRWMNYLRPDLKRGNFSSDEDELIAKLHSLLGNRWSLIAGRIPGRTDNEIKNYWNSRLRRKLNAAPGAQVEATPISCSHLDSELEQGSISTATAPSTNFTSEANQAIANPRDCSFPEFAEDFAASFSLDVPILPEYARFQTSGEATPSEPCSSSDGTASLDYCSDPQYYSSWTPVASDFSADSYAYSPESVLSEPGLDSEDNFLCSNDFASFSNRLADLDDTSFQMLLHSMPLSPMHKNLASAVDVLWS